MKNYISNGDVYYGHINLSFLISSQGDLFLSELSDEMNLERLQIKNSINKIH